MRRFFRIIQVSPKCNHVFPYKRKVDGVLKQMHIEEGDVKMLAKIEGCGYKLQNVKDGWEASEARRGTEQILPQSLWRKHSPADTPISDSGN